MSSHIFHIASPIQLGLTDTFVYLEDYISDCNLISSISSHESLAVWENRKDKLLKLQILDTHTLPQISVLDISFSDSSSVQIPVFKSKKIQFIYRVQIAGNPSYVQIAGDFNSWNPQGFNLSYIHNAWEICLEVEPGNYTYQLIVDGNWITDPQNHERLDNGFGGYNSLLRIPFSQELTYIHATTANIIDNNIIIKIEGMADGYYAFWQNSLLSENNAFFYANKLMITIPQEANTLQRSFIRCFCYSKSSISQEILIPLEYGKVIEHANLLTRNDKEAQIVYFILVDRFNNGNKRNDNPLKEHDIHPKLNYYGGDILGITKKITDGYIPDIGATTIWLSPLVQNPEFCIEKNGQKYSGYHGYWPTDSYKIDSRFGTEEELHTMVTEAHKHNISVILDYVANHVHKDNPIISEHPDWATPLILPDGSLNIGRWEEQRFTTWFDDFLPTIDFDNPEALELMTDIAVEWITKYNLDGFRHDATKHIHTKFWRTLTKKLKEHVMIPQNKRLYQIGETFGGREMLQTYINSGIHDGQFSFNVYYELRSTFLYDSYHFEKLTTALQQDLHSFGAHNLMGYITGNHDIPRFISYAGEDLWMHQNAEHEGWNRHITVKKPIGYKKLSLLTAFIATIPGVPVIYYGDEIGMPGAGDPDNRRPMRFSDLKPEELETLETTKKLLHLRKSNLALLYGDFRILLVKKMQLVYARSYFGAYVIVVFNKSPQEVTISCELPHIYSEQTFNSCNATSFSVSKKTLLIQLPPHSFEILYAQTDCSKPCAYHNEDSFFNMK